MRIIKLGIVSFIFLFLLVTIISLFIPAHIRISKATNISTDDQSTYSEYIAQLPRWKEWHPALMTVPENEFQILNDSSMNVRGTTIRVTERKKDELVTEMKTETGRPILSGFKRIQHQGDSATLQWYMDFKLRWYPWEKFRSLFYENIYGVQMEQGLSKLKELSINSRSSSN